MKATIRELSVGDMIWLTDTWMEMDYFTTIEALLFYGKAFPRRRSELVDHQRPLPDELRKKLENLREKKSAADRSHDNWRRTFYYGLLSLRYRYAEDEDLVEVIEEVLELLYPDELAIVTKSWVEEAGEVERFDDLARQEPCLSLLAQNEVNGEKLSFWGEQIVKAGRELGQFLREESQLLEQLQTLEDQEKASSISEGKARIRWMKLVVGLRRTLMLLVDDDPSMASVKEAILTPLNDRLAALSRPSPTTPTTP